MFTKLIAKKSLRSLFLIFLCVLCGFCWATSQYPQRIISLNPSVTEILFSLKLDNNIIAVTNNCNYPPAAKTKQKIGDIGLNFEKIINLKPDLVVGESSIFSESIAKLKGMNIPVLLVNCKDLENFKTSFLRLGKETGKTELARKLIRNFDAELNKIKSRSDRSRPVTSKPRVFIEIWNQPLMTAGAGTFIDEIIETAGGVNVAKNLKGGYPVVNTEFLIKNNPDVIILTTGKVKDTLGNPAFKNINAVKGKKVYKINPDIIARPTLRLADAAQEIQNWIKTK